MSFPTVGALASQSPPRRRYVGIDPSLRATGIATIDEDGTYTLRRLESEGHKTDTLHDRSVRLHNIAAEIIMAVCVADVVCIETPAYSQTTGSHHDRSGLWWLIVDGLEVEDLDLVEVSTGTVKKYATGKGNAGKDTVLANVVRRYPDAPVESNDEADAFVLAAIAARRRGPQECWPWTAATSGAGYGRFSIGGRRGRLATASRVSYELAHGPLGAAEARHTCDNPPCCNPAHLIPGTHAQNMADMARRERSPRTKLTAAQVLDIRRRRARGADVSGLAAEFGVTPSNVSQIVCGRTWKHLELAA